MNFIEKAKKVHGNKYNYSKVNYINSKTKVCITCPEHGEFWQTPNAHLNGQGCPICSGKLKRNKETWIEMAQKIHGNKYDYSKSEYVNNHTKICIICPEHGEFWQTPSNHLHGHGCSKCANLIRNISKKSSTEEFIKKARNIHGDKYDYSKVEYVNALTKVCIICPEHGEFWQTPNKHLLNRGCPICAKENKKLSISEFIDKACKIHGDKYDYSKVLYENSEMPICIICPEHGEFWQTPHTHLKGYGCNKCSESFLENKVRVILEKNKFKYEYRKHFNWLGRQELDFYLPKYKIGIECQGEEHYKPIDFFGGLKTFNKIKTNDIKKSNKCKENKIKLLYFSEKKHKTFNGIKSYTNEDIIKEFGETLEEVEKKLAMKNILMLN